MSMRLGAIGLGSLGELCVDAVADRSGVELVAGTDVSPDARDAFESRFGVPTYDDHETMLDDEQLDMAFIATPHTLHYEHAVAALERDLHVLLEKPMVTDIAHAVDLQRRAAERDRLLTVGYQRHFHSGYQAVREVLQSDRVGDVHMVACYLAQDWIENLAGSWRTDPARSGGGQLIDSGSHLLDALLWLTDAEPRRVAAVMDHRDHEVDVNTALSATLDGPDGPITASVGISADGTGFEEALTVWGTDGRLRFDGTELVVIGDDGRETHTFDPDGFGALTHRKVNAFVDAVNGDRENPVPGEFGRRVTALIEAAYRAQETGETVDVRALVETARNQDGG